MTICFIVAPQNKDTILDRIAHEIGKEFEEAIYHYGTSDVPKADHYFVTHYSLLPKVMAQVNPGITPVTVFFTHDKGGLPQYVDMFNLCHSVVAESPEGMKLLSSLGVRQDILHFLPEGGDNEIFTPHQRESSGMVLVCGTNYADGRKNPRMIHEVMQAMPHRRFKLIGRSWDTSEVLDGVKNAEIIYDLEYDRYPEQYKECSVYLSCSKLEGGGPNSLIEAMHSNIVPVVSDTGNARQYIVDSYNGFIFGPEATAQEIASLIDQAYELKPQDSLPYADIWQTVRNMTWKEYGMNMREIILNDYSTTSSQELDEMTEMEADS